MQTEAVRPSNWSAPSGRFLPASLLLLVLAVPASPQVPADLQKILERLDRLEQENRALAEEVHALRRELAASRPAPQEQSEEVSEKVDTQGYRIQEQAQTKVESSQHFPIRITGMALFNTFLNSRGSGGAQYPVLASMGQQASGGATFQQTIVGLDYRGPQTLWGGKVHGSLFMDLDGGSGRILDQELRLRTATIELDWKNRSLTAGLDKPLFSPRNPTSLAQVAVSPLTGAGNLWLWIPQVRFEQRLQFADTSGLRAQFALVQTRETPSYTAGEYEADLEASRPGLEGRFEFFHGSGGRRIEIAPGFHYSVSHVAQSSIPSSLFSLDWFTNPWQKLEFSGAFFSGQNVAHLGTGGTRQGFTVLDHRLIIPVHSRGGWAQLSYLPTQRLSFNFFSGQQDDRNADLLAGRIGKNLAGGVNLLYRLAPNVLLGLELSQVRTTYIGSGNRLNNHYDLGLAYLF